MIRTFVPRWLMYPLIIILVINLGAIYSQAPVHDPQYVAMVKLLQWRDPVSGKAIDFPIDGTATLNQRMHAVENLQELDLSYTQLGKLPSEIGNLISFTDSF